VSASQRLPAATQASFPVVLRTVVGSEVHGTGLPGLGDIDHMGIAVEHRDNVLGTGESPEAWAYRTAWSRATVEGSDPRSVVGDLDLIIYPARKWARLAIAGNPSALAPLFVDEKFVVESDQFGEQLRENRHRFMSRSLATKHIGYMIAQRERMLGIRGGMRVSRPELIRNHGFDTKFASHMLRLGYQGLGVLAEGTLHVPLPNDVAAHILAVRRGEHEQAEVVEESNRLEAAMIAALDTTTLPATGDAVWLNKWLVEAQTFIWSRRTRCARPFAA
jgi:hypothetical protein